MVAKKRGLIVIVLGIMAAAFIGYATLAGAADPGEPGSRSDPLVTRSFVEQFVSKSVKETLGAAGTTQFQWQIKNLSSGQEFVGRAGTEFIVRTGKAVVVDPTGSGIPDITAGANVMGGQVAARDHLFIIPRADGRGIRAQSAVIIMYRGGGI